jgi:MFS family permease
MNRAPLGIDRFASWAVFLAVFAVATSVSFVFAVLPSIGRTMGLSELQLGMVIAPAALVFVLTGPLWGRANVWIGQKQTLVLALTAASVSTLVFGLVVYLRLADAISVDATFAGLVLSRMCLSLFAAAILPTAQAYIADTTQHEKRTAALAQMGAGFALGLVAAPGIAGSTTRFGALVPFVIVAAILAGAMAVAFICLARTEKLVAAHRHCIERTSLARLWSLLLIMMLLYTSYAILLQVTGFQLQDQFGLSPQEAAQEAGMALMVTAASLVLSQLVLARSGMATRWTGRLLLSGSAIALAAMGLLATCHLFAIQLAAMALFGCGLGLSLPSTLSLMTLIAEAAGDQGRVGGLSGAAQGLGLVFGPLVGAASYKLDRAVPYAIAVVLLAIVCGLRLFSARTAAANR